MRVLHLSQDGLPDPRVEKIAGTLSKAGVESYFAGKGGYEGQGRVFNGIFTLSFTKAARLGIPLWYQRLKGEVKKLVDKLRPDIVHAHNVIAGKLAAELALPFVYDGHEYWARVRYPGRFVPSSIKATVWARWEKEVLQRAEAAFTVSEEIAREYMKLNPRVSVVPNFPTISEVNEISKREIRLNRLRSAYIGSLTPPFPPHRDASGLADIFLREDVGDLMVIGDRKLRSSPPIYSLGYISHAKLFRVLVNFHIGLIPWKRYYYHRYCNPNKAYEYAHSGLDVWTIDDMLPVLRYLDEHVQTFSDFDELRDMLRTYRDDIHHLVRRGLETMEFAREHLIWEKFEHRILQVYSSFF